MLPFRNLLKPATSFYWNDTLDQLFEESKAAITTEIANGVRIFDKAKPTCLATDWSQHGISFWLFQKHCLCPSTDLFCYRHGWKITLVGSRFTLPAESRYAPIDGVGIISVIHIRFIVLGSGCGWFSQQGKTFCSGMQPHSCCRSQTFAEDFWR